MEVNKDEALRCIDLAEKFILAGNKEKAEKFLIKAEKLFHTEKAKDLLESLKLLNEEKKRFMDKTSPRLRRKSGNKENIDKEKAATENIEYSKEQIEYVKRIQKCKDYYEILSVSKEATDSEIKKSYKKLALQLHPDKNKAPGASEAFKAIGNAVAILTDVEKRKQYDLYGKDNPPTARSNRNGNYHAEYTRGFEADFTADELFNMFFGSGFSSQNVFMRRQTRWPRDHENHAQHHSPANTTVLMQMLPILVLIVVSMLSSFFITEPVYSMSQNSKYPVLQQTSRLMISYYVNENFAKEFQGNLQRLEHGIEQDYLLNLKQSCYRERNIRQTEIWRAQTYGDVSKVNRMEKMKLPSCDEYFRLANKL